MHPRQLTAGHFTSYPPLARRVATRGLDVLRRLPLSFVPLLLQEVIEYDWKFPAERQEVDAQFTYMGSLSPEQLTQVMAGFNRLTLSTELERLEWVKTPSAFSERLSAHLWTTGQIASFRSAAMDFLATVRAAIPPPGPAMSRLSVAVVGQGVAETRHRVFEKLRPHGTYFTQVDPLDGLSTVMRWLEARAHKHREPFAHWYLDGGEPASPVPGGVERLAYRRLNHVRDAVVAKMRGMIRTGLGTEAQRSELMRLSPQDVGLTDAGANTVLNHFTVRLLAEGSGTQFFSTTFVQWAAREVLRRAQPVTLVARFAPRISERSMNEALRGTPTSEELDPHGALVDADMGAYYTWLNQMRLPGAKTAAFLAWFENHSAAVVIAPSVEPGVQSDMRVDVQRLLEKATA
jgi:hypothetical protein